MLALQLLVPDHNLVEVKPPSPPGPLEIVGMPPYTSLGLAPPQIPNSHSPPINLPPRAPPIIIED